MKKTVAQVELATGTAECEQFIDLASSAAKIKSER